MTGAAFIPDAATRAQIDAANPAGSVWLAANAGSGKTRVLTDRVAWLLLDGAAPERILCLTYTKAAAGEMQNRLFRQLSKWTMLSDDALRVEITRLGAARGTVPDDQLRRARTLFARAIETPGGLKIQTIHAFCASLLRRFPLEAGVSPAFSEMDETATARLQSEVLDDMASDPALQPLVDRIAARLTDAEPSAFLSDVAKHRTGFDRRLETDALKAALGIADDSPKAVRDSLPDADDLDLLEMIRDAARSLSGKTMSDLHRGLAQAILADTSDRLDLLTPILLTQKMEPRSIRWTNAARIAISEDTIDDLTAFALRLADAHVRINAFEALAQTEALHAFAPEYTARVEARKQSRGWLDFDDLISRAQRLLSTSDMAQWVLFKLDGGIDHILVDEAQDTSPGQWEVIRALASEFGAGLGARPDVRRTIFVVGDRKQSIYAFQGADLDAYEKMRTIFGGMVSRQDDGAMSGLRDHVLLHSFRSSPVILDLVDAVFADGGGVGDAPEHIAFHAEMPGRVDLWPVIDQDKADHSDRVWHDPIDRPAANDANVLLAERVAEAIDRMLKDGTPIGRDKDRRAVQAGDILILLQRRADLFHHIVRACKRKNFDLAGADRLKLSDDMAVKDLIAALTWAATPDDDLALATVLRSPLGTVDEAELFALAHGRERRRLWDALRDRNSDPEAIAMLTDLLRIADILRPYEVLQRILIRHDGRRRLLARLGDEAGEAIDALLTQALAYEQLETPSLTGFLGWLASADVDVKRQAGKGSIRVMSVHGAKGLESPVVILPETMKRAPRGISGVQRLPDGLPVWMPAKANWSPAMHDASDRALANDRAERDRLLYVAMTRAESWLIVGAAGNVGEDADDSWYNKIAAAMENRDAEDYDFGFGQGRRLEIGDWSGVAPNRTDMPTADDRTPAWLRTSIAPPTKAATRIAPSGLPGAKALPGEAGVDTATALRRGTAIHALLEHLPRLGQETWMERGPAILATYADVQEDEIGDLLAEAAAVLNHPDLAHVFAGGTLAEVPFALPPTVDRPAIVGTIDRVILTPDCVHIVDFKTNTEIPPTPESIPDGLLRQMAAYRLAAESIWPDRQVQVAILWTKGPRLMDLPHDLVTDLDAGIDPLVLPA